MDVMKMANANVRVLQELDKCTDKLETFNAYLNDVQGYTNTIHRFTTLFEQESNRLHVLEEIQQFFTRHKAEIAKDTADADVTLKEALSELRTSTANNVSELNKQLTSQSDEFKTFLKEEKESFEKLNEDIKAQFKERINEMPALVDNIKEIAQIPEHLDRLVEKVEQSNALLANKISESLNQTVQTISKTMTKNVPQRPVEIVASPSVKMLPIWMNWTIIVTLIVIALSCVLSLAYNVLNKETLPNAKASKHIVVEKPKEVVPEDTTKVLSNDTIKNVKPKS